MNYCIFTFYNRQNNRQKKWRVMKKLSFILVPILLTVFLFSCGESSYVSTSDIDAVAKSFVKLAFSLGRYDKDYVDGYIGSEELKKEALRDTLQPDEIIRYADELLIWLNTAAQGGAEIDSITRERADYLRALVLALKTRAQMINGKKFSFDEESKLIYDVVAPTFSLDYYGSILMKIDSLLPGEGDINLRWNEFRKRFIIPREKLDTIFKTAIAECRLRTKKHIKLPDNENFNFELVENKPWGAYNWYKGNGKSLIQINVSMPIYIDRVIDYACHEGYPGHHVYHTLHDLNLYRQNGWVEFSILPLFSPTAIISEGLANFGIEVAFTKQEKLDYEKNVLCKLAEISSEDIEKYYQILDYKKKLRYAGIEAARRYLDGKINKQQAVNFLMFYQLRTEKEAENSISFFETYRSYIVSYSIGVDLLREYFKNKGADTQEKKWRVYDALVSNPILPKDIR